MSKKRFFILLLFLVIIDQLTKSLVVAYIHNEIKIFKFISLVNVKNSGAAFSSFTSNTLILTIIGIIAFCVLSFLFIKNKINTYYWLLIFGGVAGNLCDRFFREPKVFYGHVVDFISIGWWPAFNVADSAIVIGAAILIFDSFKETSKNENGTNKL